MDIHHLAFRTDQVEELERFYRDVVGLEAPPGAPHAEDRVWLRAGATWVMIERRTESEPVLPRRSMDLVAFAIRSIEKEAFLEKLLCVGVAVEQETDFTVYFRDPDGRRVGVSRYPEPPQSQAALSPPASPPRT